MTTLDNATVASAPVLRRLSAVRLGRASRTATEA